MTRFPSIQKPRSSGVNRFGVRTWGFLAEAMDSVHAVKSVFGRVKNKIFELSPVFPHNLWRVGLPNFWESELVTDLTFL